jgi:hypothetical protein
MIEADIIKGTQQAKRKTATSSVVDSSEGT